MKSFNYTITDAIGIHARPAGMLVKGAKKYESAIILKCGEKQADVRKLMLLMSMGVKCGDEVTIEVTGADEEAACAAMETFFKENL